MTKRIGAFVLTPVVLLLLPVPASAKLNVSTLSAISANLGTVTAGSITGVTITAGGTVTLDSSGISIAVGTGANNRYKFSDGTYIQSSSGNVAISGSASVQLVGMGGGIIVLAAKTIPSGASHPDLGDGTARFTDLYLNGTVYTGLAGGAGRYACINASGVLFSQAGGC